MREGVMGRILFLSTPQANKKRESDDMNSH